MKNNLLNIAKIGKTVGLKGEVKLHLLTDFPEQFKNGATFFYKKGELTIEYYNINRDIVKFIGFNNKESVQRLTNQLISTTFEDTRVNCDLDKDEAFWFDMINCQVFENEKLLGEVSEVQRMLDIDYLLIQTDKRLVDDNLPNSFLIPYVDRRIISLDIKNKKIVTIGSLDILEAS